VQPLGKPNTMKQFPKPELTEESLFIYLLLKPTISALQMGLSLNLATTFPVLLIPWSVHFAFTKKHCLFSNCMKLVVEQIELRS